MENEPKHIGVLFVLQQNGIASRMTCSLFSSLAIPLYSEVMRHFAMFARENILFQLTEIPAI